MNFNTYTVTTMRHQEVMEFVQDCWDFATTVYFNYLYIP